MKVLGIESASLVASVAMVCDGQMTAEYTLNLKKTHSQTLLPMIDQMMQLLGEDVSTVDAIAVSGGPGSFTGLRIGAATAKGIGFVTGKPLVNVPTMDAMAYGVYVTDAIICPMLDARRKQAYRRRRRLPGYPGREAHGTLHLRACPVKPPERRFRGSPGREDGPSGRDGQRCGIPAGLPEKIPGRAGERCGGTAGRAGQAGSRNRGA